MKDTINVGLIGYGYMGKMHTLCYENIKYYYDLEGKKINLYALSSSKSIDEIGNYKKAYTNYKDLINDENVDVVDICLPNSMHKEVLIEAIKAGKHIYCEKPLALNLKEAEEVMTVMEETSYKGINRMVFEYRFIPAIMRAKQMIDEGMIGKIINFNFKYYGSEFLNPNRPISWQSTKEIAGGGVLYALGSHAIDLIHYLVGDVTSLYANTQTHYKERPLKDSSGFKTVETEDIVNAQLTVGDDILGTLVLSQMAAGSGTDVEFEIYGELGSIKFNHSNPNVIKYFSANDIDNPIGGISGFKEIETTQKYPKPAIFPPPRVNISWIRYHIASQFDFIQAVFENKETSPDIKDGFKVQKVMDKIYESASLNKVLKF